MKLWNMINNKVGNIDQDTFNKYGIIVIGCVIGVMCVVGYWNWLS